MNKRTRNLAIAVSAIGLLMTTAACDTNSDSQASSQSLTNTYTNSATSAVPYPLHDMQAGGWTERRLLAEHLKRQNNPNGLRWVVLLNMQGQPIVSWPLQGMVFDPNSQLTTAQIVNGCGSSSTCGAVTNAAGDNGTWGPEAGAAAFFTTSGVEIQLPASAIWVESDAPINIETKPLITYDVNATPSVNAGGVKIGGGR